MFALLWGLGATGFGWVVATNFRGAAERFHRYSQRSAPFAGKSPAPLGVGFVRAVAAVFALAGPAFLAFGLMGVAEGDSTPGQVPDFPGLFDLAMFVITAGALWSMWRRPGMLRREWAAGGVLVRAGCVVATAAVVGIPLAMVTGYAGVLMADWLLGGAALLTVLAAGRADRDAEADRPEGPGAAGA